MSGQSSTAKSFDPPTQNTINGRIAGNFRGAYISRIDIKFIFLVTNLADGNY